ncbi:MAG: sulfatase [Gemmatimonadota bacterium]|nr:sulfatase [Gemmatimonadota bacterium]MDH5198438.1 sulfatase [Gemmatimonadota bacterium]
MTVARPCVLSLALALLGLGCASNRPPQRPNVLFIAVDDLRPELGAYGNPDIKTPAIDRLAESGVTFLQAHVQQAVCNPSRASLLTGLRPDSLRVWTLQTRFRDSVPDVVTLPQHFMLHGYHTAAIGKIYHNIIPDSLSWSEPKLHVAGYPFDPDAVYRDPEYVAIQEARKAQIIAEGRQDRFIDQYGQWYLKATASEMPDVPDNAYFDGAQTDVAIGKLEEYRNGTQPFFLAVGYYRPHLPFNAPRKYWDLYDPDSIPPAENSFVPDGAPSMAMNTMRELRGYTDFRHVVHPAQGQLSEAEARRLKHGYYAAVSYVDAQIGRLLDALDSLGLTDNTIVVLWGDHGWKLGEHGSWAKMTNYEIDTRAPLIIRAPGHAGGTQIDRMVEFVDIYPTLTELAGLPLPVHLQGTSAVPLMHDPARAWKPAVFSQFLREGAWIAPDSVVYMGYAMRTERYRYVAWMDWQTQAYVAYELYDHASDPAENVNLAGRAEYAEVMAELEAQRRAGWPAALPPRETHR